METSIPKQILKGQCLNIAFNNIDIKSKTPMKDILERTVYAKMLYFELLKQNYHDW